MKRPAKEKKENGEEEEEGGDVHDRSTKKARINGENKSTNNQNVDEGEEEAES